MKKLAPGLQLDAMMPLIRQLKKDYHFGFMYILSVCKRLKAGVCKHGIDEYNFLVVVIVFENQRFRIIIRVAALGGSGHKQVSCNLMATVQP